MSIHGPAGLPADLVRLVERTEARALAEAKDLVEHPDSNVTLQRLREALRVRRELLSVTSQIAKAYDESADRILRNLKA